MANNETVLASDRFDWNFGDTLELELSVNGDKLTGSVNGTLILDATDSALLSGGIALVSEEGRTATNQVRVSPI